MFRNREKSKIVELQNTFQILPNSKSKPHGPRKSQKTWKCDQIFIIFLCPYTEICLDDPFDIMTGWTKEELGFDSQLRQDISPISKRPERISRTTNHLANGYWD
jgi:hypothetical protein